ncbi:MAG: phosphoglycerate dehydrogenase [Spirochaetaceae bacterium]
MYIVKTLNTIADRGMNLLREGGISIDNEAGDPDGILVRSANLHEASFSPNLKAIARAGAGVNNIPVDRCTDRGIVVFNTPGANANSVKELVIAALLLSSRKIHHGLSWTQSISPEEREVSRLVEGEKKRFAGPEIAGKRLGVIGLGAIGVMVANAAVSLDMEVAGFDPFISVESAWGLHRGVERARNLETLLSSCDYISIHVPLNENTRGFLGAEEFAKVKRGARLLNFARGPLVENRAVVDAIEAGRLSAYVTDFPEAELLGRDEILCVPHLGASTPEAEENCAVMAAGQLIDYLEHGNIRNSVNFPDCHMEMTCDYRLVVANRNIPNMVGQIASILAEEAINIADLLNRHRGEIAYNIIDIDTRASERAVERIESIEGVIMVRSISRRIEA